jgi:hypothetical protein
MARDRLPMALSLCIATPVHSQTRSSGPDLAGPSLIVTPSPSCCSDRPANGYDRCGGNSAGTLHWAGPDKAAASCQFSGCSRVCVCARDEELSGEVASYDAVLHGIMAVLLP